VNVPAARLVFSTEDRAAILGLIDESLQSGMLTLGPHTRALEAAFAARHDTPHAIAVSSGTSAIEIVLRALGVSGREVVVPAVTFFATAAAVIHAGGVPRFTDVALTTLSLTVESVESALSANTAAVVMVHIAGLVSPDVVAIRDLCNHRGIVLVEDAAHAHGSSYLGQPAGTFGAAGTFSCYPTKVITAGEGGVIITADERLRDEALIYRDQGKAGFHGGAHVRMGYAWRMSEVQAAIALVHLRRLDEFIAVRNSVARRYTEALAAIDRVSPLPLPAGCASNYYKYVALLDPGIDRQELRARLAEFGVALSGEVYQTPLHREPIFQHLSPGRLPVAEDVCARQICLPVHSDMTNDEVDQVITALAKALG
jgi:dTDP-4-amino-4,6-dideoxygalactose transaminase